MIKLKWWIEVVASPSAWQQVEKPNLRQTRTRLRLHSMARQASKGISAEAW